MGWIREGRLPGLLPAVACAVLLVDLLATGGIGLPSVAGTLWLLLALGLQGERPRNLHPAAAWAALAGGNGSGGGVLRHGLQPRARLPGPIAVGRTGSSPGGRAFGGSRGGRPVGKRAVAAIGGDPVRKLVAGARRTGFRTLRGGRRQDPQLAPNSAPAWLASGDWYFRAASKADSPTGKPADEIRQKAVAAYRQAVMLYPNSAVYRAKLAEAYRASGDSPPFAARPRLALRLDGLTPHTDKKLPADLRERLARDLGTP